MRLTGELCTVGDMQPEDMPPAGLPGLQLRLDDGRVVSVIGLSREEARAVAASFLDRVSLTVEGDYADKA